MLDQAIADKKAQVRVVAYDLNEPGVVSRLEKLGPRLKVIIDDSADHGAAGSGENQAADRLSASAGAANVKRQHMLSLQHNKTIVVDGPKASRSCAARPISAGAASSCKSNNAMILQGAKRGEAVPRGVRGLLGERRRRPSANGASAQWSDLGLDRDQRARSVFTSRVGQCAVEDDRRRHR